MPNSLSGSNPLIAQLMLHCGVAAEAYYSSSNTISGGSISDMKRFFKYSLEMKGVYKSSMTNAAFENLLISELNAGRVVAAAGGSHQYLIDGYQTTPTLKFHINFGWGGAYNGYYSIHNVMVASTNYTPNLITYQIKPLVDGFEMTDTITVSNASGNANFELSSLNNWTLVGNSSWITPAVSSGLPGYYNLNASISANNSYSTRYGSIQYSNGTITRTLVVKQTGIAPYLYVTPSSSSVASGGGSVPVTITSDSSWTASSAQGWISLSATSGVGNGSITITAAPNGVTARTGYVTIQRGSFSQSLEIIQGSSSSFWCVPFITATGSDGVSQVQFNAINRVSSINEGYVLTSDSSDVYLDSTYSIAVTIQGGVAPGVWIDWNIDGDFSDPGEAVVSPSGSWYPSFNSTKTATIVVPTTAQTGVTRMRVYAKDFGTGPVTNPCNTSDNGGDIEDYYIVIKDAKFIEPSVSILTFPANGGGMNCTLTTDSLWTMNSAPSWITASQTSGGNNALVTYTANTNSGFTARNGLIAFSRGTKTAFVNVYQSPQDTSLFFAQDTLYVTSNGITAATVDVLSNVSYSITASDPWIFTSSASGAGNSSLSVDILSNTSAIRTGWLIVQQGTWSDSLVIYQDSVSSMLTVNPDTITVTAAGGGYNFDITTPSTWNISIPSTWLSTSVITGTGNETITLTIDSNTGPERSMDIQVSTSGASKMVHIIQSAEDLSLFEQKQQFEMYPNPTNEWVIVECTSDVNRFILTNLLGDVMIEGVLDGPKTSIRLPSICPGMYMMQVYVGQQLVGIQQLVKVE
jgi:hypothetical protein